MSYSLGLDVGSVRAKVALISEDGKAVYLDSEKITASPKSAVNSLISRLGAEVQSQGNRHGRSLGLRQGCDTQGAELVGILQLAGDCFRSSPFLSQCQNHRTNRWPELLCHYA